MCDKIKIKIYNCEHFEAEYDNLGKYYWCHNPNCPTRECWCDNFIESYICPGFKKRKGDKGSILLYSKKTIDYIQNNFVKKILKQCTDEYDDCVNKCKTFKERKIKLLGAINKLKKWKPPCLENNEQKDKS